MELIQIFCLYSILVFGLAEILARPLTRGKGICYRICAYIVVGNFYIMQMMFLLAYIKCLYQPVLLVSFPAVALLVRFLLERKRLYAYWRAKYDAACRLAKGEYGGHLAGQRILQKGFRWATRCISSVFKGKVPEVILLAAALGINVYYFSYQTLHFMSYAAPDVEVHLNWIQSLVGGKLFPAGVYPFGMHCVGAAISLAFGVSAVTVARMLGVVTSFYIMLLCYLFVKQLCRLRYAPMVGFMIYTIANLTVDSTYMRYSAMISQEYAMLFLVPVMFFLYRYLNGKKMQDLVLFGLAFASTLAVHFYITAIACFFFLAIGVVYLYRMIKRKLLVPLILCGIVSIFAALLPLAVGLCMGYPLEQSFTYGASVILNDPQMYGDNSENEKQAETEKKKDPPKIDAINVGKQLERYLLKDARYLWIFAIPLLLVLLEWFIRLCCRRMTDRILEYLSQMIFFLFLLVELLLGAFDYPVLIEPKRMGIFVSYMLPLFMAIPFEMFYTLVQSKRCGKVICNTAALGCLGITCFSICLQGNWKELPTVYYFQTTGAMASTCDIIRDYEKYSWTIVSPVNETSLVYNSGYHYEMIDFIKCLEHYREGMELYIPTKYVFFYVEKMPIERYGWAFSVDDEILRKREKISKDAALTPLGGGFRKPDEYYKKKRMELMSRMYYWVQAYRKYFPDEMTVFYEDDEMVVYRLKQNTYALNNLAIDYRKDLRNG